MTSVARWRLPSYSSYYHPSTKAVLSLSRFSHAASILILLAIPLSYPSEFQNNKVYCNSHHHYSHTNIYIMKTLKTCIQVFAFVGTAVVFISSQICPAFWRDTDFLKQSQTPCTAEDALPLTVFDEPPNVDGGQGPVATGIKIVGGKNSSDVVGRDWNDGSGRLAGLVYLSRRNWQPRWLLQKRGELVCMKPASSQSNIHKLWSESLADHDLDKRCWERILFFFQRRPSVCGSRWVSTHVRN